MISLLTAGIYAAVFTTCFIYLLCVHKGIDVGLHAQGSIPGDGTARLGQGVLWSTEEYRLDRSHLPALKANMNQCYSTPAPGCSKIAHLEYWLEPPTTLAIKPKCSASGCEVSVSFPFGAVGGMPFKQTSDDMLQAIHKGCIRGPPAVLDFKAIVDSEATRRLWYKQVFLKVTYQGNPRTSQLQGDRNMTSIVPLLDEQCQAQFLFGVIKIHKSTKRSWAGSEKE